MEKISCDRRVCFCIFVLDKNTPVDNYASVGLMRICPFGKGMLTLETKDKKTNGQSVMLQHLHLFWFSKFANCLVANRPRPMPNSFLQFHAQCWSIPSPPRSRQDNFFFRGLKNTQNALCCLDSCPRHEGRTRHM